ncbi:MAG: DUF2442 domain-containing protein [Candidatus Adiutrix sp.]|jgi:hypothetical protein|nr:DUF2442 domain-containing protein [Candidatus Adiutrix sp.]
MFIIDGIAYAGEASKMPEVVEVRPLNDYTLWLRFSTGEVKIFDVKPLLDRPVFAPLKDVGVFQSVYLDYGVTVWNDGNIDIAPETLYEKSTPALWE